MDVLVRSSALLKSFLNRRFTLPIYLKNGGSNFKAINFIPSLRINIEILLSAHGDFFLLPLPFFRVFFQSNTLSEDLFLILRNTRSHNRFYLTLLWRRPLSYRNQSIDFRHKSMDWFLYDNGLRHERVKDCYFSP